MNVSLNHEQLVTLVMACNELEIIRHEQIRHGYPLAPEQKKNIRIAARRLHRCRVYDVLEAALEELES